MFRPACAPKKIWTEVESTTSGYLWHVNTWTLGMRGLGCWMESNFAVAVCLNKPNLPNCLSRHGTTWAPPANQIPRVGVFSICQNPNAHLSRLSILPENMLFTCCCRFGRFVNSGSEFRRLHCWSTPHCETCTFWPKVSALRKKFCNWANALGLEIAIRLKRGPVLWEITRVQWGTSWTTSIYIYTSTVTPQGTLSKHT